eukprot:scaffold739_cov166-Pinguiococcus_pyrenoidosus.AAC.4
MRKIGTVTRDAPAGEACRSCRASPGRTANVSPLVRVVRDSFRSGGTQARDASASSRLSGSEASPSDLRGREITMLFRSQRAPPVMRRKSLLSSSSEKAVSVGSSTEVRKAVQSSAKALCTSETAGLLWAA